jgi:predicted HTH domain antitoxin
MQTIVGRVTEEQKKLLERLAKLEKVDRSKMLRETLDIGIKQKLIDLSLEEYQKGRISFGKAAELARISIWEMIDLMKERKIDYGYTAEDLEKDLKRFKR